MKKIPTSMIWAFVIFGIACSAQASKSPITGFECLSSDGTVRRFNIDLKKSRFDEGSGFQRLNKVTDTVITLKGPNPDLLYSPMGPVLASLELNRQTLLLTDQLIVPDKQINRVAQFQCVTRAAIDFKAGQKF